MDSNRNPLLVLRVRDADSQCSLARKIMVITEFVQMNTWALLFRIPLASVWALLLSLNLLEADPH